MNGTLVFFWGKHIEIVYRTRDLDTDRVRVDEIRIDGENLTDDFVRLELDDCYLSNVVKLIIENL